MENDSGGAAWGGASPAKFYLGQLIAYNRLYRGKHRAKRSMNVSASF